MPAPPRISIITPTRNRRDVLMRAVESVRAQTLTDFEHIVVDDGSTDDTAAAIAKLDEPRLVYLALPGWSGANAARNAGIARAAAPVVTFLDSDDMFLPDRLATTLQRFDSDPSLQLMLSSFRKSKRGTMPGSTNPSGTIGPQMLERALISQCLFIAGSAITVRREALLAVDGFDTELLRLQDRDLLLRLSRHFGALLSAHIDWIKHDSADSISGRPEGYIEAYAQLLARNPRMNEVLPEIAPYMVARHILAHLFNGRLGPAVADFRTSKASSVLGYGAAALARGYVHGRRRRRQIRQEMAAAVRLPASTAEAGLHPASAGEPAAAAPLLPAGPTEAGEGR